MLRTLLLNLVGRLDSLYWLTKGGFEHIYNILTQILLALVTTYKMMFMLLSLMFMPNSEQA